MNETQEEQQPKPFNPNDHLMQIKNKGGSSDYLPVAWRLVWFREQCPEGVIETEMLHLDLDRETEEEGYAWNEQTRRSEKITKRGLGIAVFRAVIKDGKGGIATGTKSEKAASFPDYIEKAETGAIGRALAALGYGTQFAPDLDEQHRLVDSPVPSSSSTTREPSPAPHQKGKVTQVPLNKDGGVVGMIETAKGRCEKLRLDWEEFKAEVFGYTISDRELIVSSFVKINRLLTEKELHSTLSA